VGRKLARFRISLKDHRTLKGIKVELIKTDTLWGEARFRLRVNGRAARQIKEATLTEVFDRLRRWLAKRT
jgi:hypothetical protein